jgi:membrane protein implicated in regulation of membrane protease activity
LWAVVAVGFTLGELHTNSLYLAPFALGGLIAALLSLIGVGSLLSAVGFVGASLLIIVLLRPFAVRHRRSAPALRTGAAALVVERIAKREGVGTVKVGCEVWAARAFDEQQVFGAGEQVELVEIRGATALVMP